MVILLAMPTNNELKLKIATSHYVNHEDACLFKAKLFTVLAGLVKITELFPSVK